MKPLYSVSYVFSDPRVRNYSITGIPGLSTYANTLAWLAVVEEVYQELAEQGWKVWGRKEEHKALDPSGGPNSSGYVAVYFSAQKRGR